MDQVRVSLIGDRRRGLFLQLEGGDPGGGDPLHKTVSAWAGWRRMPQSHGSTSVFRAAAWLAQLQPLLHLRAKIAWAPEAAAWRDAQLEAFDRRELAIEGKVAKEEPAKWAAGGRPPMDHQVQLLRALTEMDGAALVKDDMGLCKTSSALLAFKASSCRRALVVCPKSVKLNWPDEIVMTWGLDPKLAADRATNPRIYVLDGTPTKRANEITYMRAAIDEGLHAIAIVNYDMLRSMNEQAWTTLERWVGGECLIADEFHYCKAAGNKRTEAVRALMALASLRLGLTGTPVQNTVEDLFAQYELLRPGTWVSYHDFANRHLVMSKVPVQPGSKRTRDIVRGGKNLQELARIGSTMCIGRKKEEVLNLPPLIRTKPRIELDGLHVDVYQAMKQFARVELEKLVDLTVEGDGEKKPITIFHPLARTGVECAMRCEMIAQGFISGLPELYAEQIAPLIAGKGERIEGIPNAFVFPDSPKLEWIVETTEKTLKERPVVIVSRFNAPLHWLQKRLGAVMLVGSMNAVDRQIAINSFRKGESRVILVQVKLAEGFNLQNATDMLFLGRDWAPAKNWQAEGRCHRMGVAGTVNVQIPIVHKSVEVFLDRKLDAKDADAQQAMAKVTPRELLEAL